MSEKYKVIESSTPTFITMTVVGWVDLFTRSRYTKILDDAVKYCITNKGLVVHAYVYMTNHLHMIVSSEKNEIQNIVRDFKKHTSKELVDAIDGKHESRRVWMLNKFSFEAERTKRAKNYKLWQDGFHPVILDTNKKRDQRVRYIHYNPVHAGFVNHERDWANSSYLAYEVGNVQTNFKIEPLW